MEDLRVILNAVLPPFAIVALGYILQRRRRMDPAPIVDLAMLLAVPCLAYDAIVGAELPAADVGGIAAAAAGVLLGSALLGWAALRLAGIRSRGLLLPIIFMNAVNLPFPITFFLWGDEGQARAVVYYLVVVIVMYTAGMVIACGKADWRHLAAEPVIWATAAALAVKGLGWRTPTVVAETVGLLGGAAIPLVLILLGMQLREVRAASLRPALLASAVRMGGGLAVGVLLATLLGLDGHARNVVILMSAMPAAVITGMIAARYDCDADLVSATVLVSTVAALFVLPAVLWFL